MKTKLALLIGSACLTLNTTAQNIGINGTGANAHASALLDIDDAGSNNKGLLIPRIPLTAINVAAPVTSPVTSLLVYNTATASTGTNAVSAGYYYWDGAKWVRFAFNSSGSMTEAWTTTGNAGTNPTTNFIGTTNAQDLVFRTNNTEKMRIMSGGNMGIGTTNPLEKLHIFGGNVTIADNTKANFNVNRTSQFLYVDNIKSWSDNGLRIYDGNTNGYIDINNASDTYIQSHSTAGVASGILNESGGGTDASYSDILLNPYGGNVGIGTTSPNYKLEVASSFSPAILVGTGGFGSQGALHLGNKNHGIIRGNSSAALGFTPNANDVTVYTSGSAAKFYLAHGATGLATPRLTIMENGKIGINTTNPTEQFEIQGSVKIVDGTQGAGKVLTSDANGKADWQSPTGFGSIKINATGTWSCPWNGGVSGSGFATGMSVTIPSNGWYVFETGLTVHTSDCNDYWLYINGIGDIWRAYCSVTGVAYMVPRDQNRILYLTAGVYPILAGKTQNNAPIVGGCDEGNPSLYIRFVKVQI